MNARRINTLMIVILSLLSTSFHCDAQIMVRIAGTGTCDTTREGAIAKNANICAPWGMSMDDSGNLFIGQWLSGVISKITNSGHIYHFAGRSGSTDNSGDGGLADTAGIYAPWYLYMDKHKNLFVNAGQGLYRKISPTGLITGFAGNDTATSYVEGVPATSTSLRIAFLAGATSIVEDKHSNMLIGLGTYYPFRNDTSHSYIRKVNATGIITTFAGNGSDTSDGILAINARIPNVVGMAIDDSDNLYLSSGFSIMKIDKNGIYSFYAGHGTDSSDGASKENALIYPYALAISPAGELYFSEREHGYRIKKISRLGKVINVVGDGVRGYSGDSVVAAHSHIFAANDLTFDKDGNLYFNVEDGNFAMIWKLILSDTKTPMTSVKEHCKIAPNPSSGVFNFSISEYFNGGKLVVTNSMGQVVCKTQIDVNDFKLDITRQPDGVYFATLLNNDYSLREDFKLIKTCKY